MGREQRRRHGHGSWTRHALKSPAHRLSRRIGRRRSLVPPHLLRRSMLPCLQCSPASDHCSCIKMMQARHPLRAQPLRRRHHRFPSLLRQPPAPCWRSQVPAPPQSLLPWPARWACSPLLICGQKPHPHACMKVSAKPPAAVPLEQTSHAFLLVHQAHA